MKLILYNCEKSKNEFNFNLGDSMEIDNCNTRANISIINPSFILTRNDKIFSYNYLYCDTFNRYYFIDSIIIDGNILYLNCSIDVLNSFSNQILNSELYCIRSFSNYNENITDSIFPAELNTEIKTLTVNNPYTNFNAGYYIIAIANGDDETTHIGTNVYYVLNESQMTDFMEDLMNTSGISISDFGENLIKSIINPLQYIRSCFWIPFNPDCNKKDVSQISFGGWSSSASCKCIDFQENSDTYTNINVVFSDGKSLLDSAYNFLNFEPYSTLTLTCYPFGQFVLPRAIVSKILDGNDLYIKLYCDNLTGDCTFILTCGGDESLFINKVQLGVEIPIGEILQNFASGILESAGGVASAFHGNVVGAASGIVSGIESLMPEVSVNGICGGFAQLMLDNKWELTRKYYNVTVDKEFLGLPCCKNVTLKDLNGFAQFSNVQFNKSNMLEMEYENAVALLESGVFINVQY